MEVVIKSKKNCMLHLDAGASLLEALTTLMWWL